MPRSRQFTSLHGILFLSGVAGLGYEIAWTKRLSVSLGHEIPGVLAVVAAFFAGLALGAWALDRTISRSRVPARWYIGCELVIAGWSLLTLPLMTWLDGQLPGWIGIGPSPWRHWALAFIVPAIALAPATIAMGATLPAMERVFARMRQDGRVVAGLYAANTAGAAVGTLLVAFVLLRHLGTSKTIVWLAIVNIICAVLVAQSFARGERAREAVKDESASPAAPVRLLATLFITGLLGVGYQVLGLRVLSQILENTVYTFALILATFLIGTTIGASFYQRWLSRASFEAVLTWLVQLIGLTGALGLIIAVNGRSIRNALPMDGIMAELCLAAMVFLLPTIAMGATFSHLAQAMRSRRGGIGLALGVNTIGSSLAPVIIGVIGISTLGLRTTSIFCLLAYLLLIPSFEPRRLAPGALLLIAVLVLPSSFLLVQPLPGGQVMAVREGVHATVAVVNGERTLPDGSTTELRVLKVNDKFAMGGTGLAFAERRQAHLPMLLHPDPRSVLTLGVATGNTTAAAARHTGADVTGVELLPEVLDLLPYFVETNGRIADDERVTLHAADARRFVRATDQQYDVIIGDLFHPGRDGAGLLYTVEHFQAIGQRLARGGVYCQWLPLYQMDDEIVRQIMGTMSAVFPDTWAMLCTFGIDTPMLGLVTGAPLGDSLIRRIDVGLAEGPRGALLDAGIRTRLDVLSMFVGDAGWVRAQSLTPLNTDDHTVVIFNAPRYLYDVGDEQVVARATMDRILAAPPGEPLLEALSIVRGTVEPRLRARGPYLRAEYLLKTEGDAALDDAWESMCEALAADPTFSLIESRMIQISQGVDNARAIAWLDAAVDAVPESPRLFSEYRRRQQAAAEN
ncbi:MAG: fused MFS/spermidine synthase [Planctomycetota bacterium]